MRRLSSPLLAIFGAPLALVQLACWRAPTPSAAVDVPPAGAFPHELLGKVLAANVDARGMIDYAGVAADRSDLDRYIATLAVVSPDSQPELFPTQQDQLAYWINAYNALALTGVLARPGITTVNPGKVGLTEFFNLTTYDLGGKRVSLYKLENSIVRERFGDARIHFALNCMSMGCPRLPQTPFLPHTLDGQLDAAAVEFFAHPDKLYIDDAGVVHISQILEWYAADFDNDPVAYANRYGQDLPPDSAVAYIPYDWALISQPGRGP